MEKDEGLRTVECLRGRLLAERQASKSAKEDAQVMGNKLIELENKLREETKLRTKAEKRLKFLRKKLESLNIILPSLEESEQSSSSENCAVSCVSSTSSTSVSKETEESNSKSQNAVPEISKEMEENASSTCTSIKEFEIPLNIEENSNSPKSAKSDTTKDSSHADPKIDDTSSSSLKASTMENENEDDDYVDDSLALVPMEQPETKQVAPEIKIPSKSIGEVLDTLKHARESIQSSMELRRRQMIRVGPS
ncbi:hypothetical protein CCACVL1_17668 [Corchorus capsularis]|uniref:Uncharacterized protein n=1 Tax=Corchorus capsularis TaxID=210143 RepID=A0A1R3HQI7_COCAP|nr:hypothetical protein CCACVL1_17668 [Corchorus capsularis]